jgi:hypothetical protein
MRPYYRLLVLNLSVMVPFSVAMSLHIFRRPAFVVVQLALLVANYVITRKVAHEGESRFVESNRWGFGLWSAWIFGPLSTGWLPLWLAFLFVKPDFFGIVNLAPIAYFAYSFWSAVDESERRRANNLRSG